MSTSAVVAVSAKVPTVLKHEGQPEWGMGLVVEEDPKYWVLFFENAGERKFIKDKAKVLVPVTTLTASELNKLQTKASHRHQKPRAANAGPGKPKVLKARFRSFDDQMFLFLKIFPGGFAGDAFKEERKDAAIAQAQQELSKEQFASATPAALFESAKKLLKTTKIVFPIEGAIPFAAMDDESRTKAMEALKELLHGEGEYGVRLERFAASMTLKNKNGPLAVSWPLATVLGALFNPAQNIVVKPTAFSTQALTLGMQAEKAQPVTAGGYRTFFTIATRTQQALVGAGQQPRDLMDVYSFISRTHADKSE